MSPGITEIDETGAAPLTHGGMLDEQAMDAAQTRMTHPFATYIEEVRKATGLPDSQSAREVVSAVCGSVARLAILVEEDFEAQAEHIAKLIADDRRQQKDPQLWEGPAKKVAEHALRMRQEGKGVIADQAAAA
jgi:uncharacterized protein (DUF2267 family)